MNRPIRGAGALLLSACLGSCADTTAYVHGDGGQRGGIATMAVRAQSYNPTHAQLEWVAAVVDDGNQVIVLSPNTATLLRAGAVTGVVNGHTFPSAAAIPAADGNGQWLVGVEAGGQLYRLRAGRDFEDVSARYGFAPGGATAVRAACALNGRSAGFLLASGELAVADGQSVSRYRLTAPAPAADKPRLSCGGGRVALVLPGEVRTFDAKSRQLRSFALPAVDAAFDGRGRLVVATAASLYIEEPAAGGELALRYLARDKERPLHSLASTANRVWFAAGEELGAIEPPPAAGAAAPIAVTRGAQLSPSSRLVGTATGDVWVLADGQLRRFGRDDGALQPKERWAQLIAPVFARSCTACHLPGGRAGIDLSTPAAWDSKRELIRERVIEKHNMPPSGSPLSDADRGAIQSWLDSEP